jgi:hypothetical protein
VTGNIVVSAVSMTSVSIPEGIEHITGDLTISLTSSITSVSASGLQTVSGTFELLNLTALANLDAPFLSSVGSLTFIILPVLSTMTLGITEVNNIEISDTQLASLDGISLTSINDFGIGNPPLFKRFLFIDNNRYLTSISQPSLKEINGALNIAANSPQLIVSLPALITVQNASFRNIQSVSFNNLTNVTSNLGFFDSSMTSIAAPNLTVVESSLSFVNCSQLTNMSFPKLTEIGGTFLIANNTDLTDITGFDEVQTIGGSIDWTGSFDNASLPAINDIRGGVNVQSSSQTFQCPFPQIQNNGVVKGKGFVCTGKVANPSSGVNGTNQTANSGPGGGKSSANRLASSGVSFAVIGVLVALALQYLV